MLMSSAGPAVKATSGGTIGVLRPLTPGLRQAPLLMIALFSHVCSLYFALWTTVTLGLQCCVCVCVCAELTKRIATTRSLCINPIVCLVFVMDKSSPLLILQTHMIIYICAVCQGTYSSFFHWLHMMFRFCNSEKNSENETRTTEPTVFSIGPVLVWRCVMIDGSAKQLVTQRWEGL